MACCWPAETPMTIQIQLEEEIMEIEPPPAGGPQQNTSGNTTTTTNDNEPKQSGEVAAIGTNANNRSVYYVIEEIPNQEFDYQNETLVILDDEPDEPPDAVQRPAAVQTLAAVETQVAVTVAAAAPEPRRQVNSDAQEDQEQEAPSRKRMRIENCSRSLPTQLQEATCRRQDNDKASSNTGDTSEKKEDEKTKQNANSNEPDTKIEDKIEVAEGSSCAKKQKIEETKGEKAKEEDKYKAGERLDFAKEEKIEKNKVEKEEGKNEVGEGWGCTKIKIEEPEGDIYGCSDDSTESYYVYE